MRKKISRKRKNIHGTVFRLFFSLIAISILVILIYPLLTTKSVPPCANSISCTESMKLNIEKNATGIFCNKKVIAPEIDQSIGTSKPTVLGTESGSGEKHIYINLATQTLSAYQGNKLFIQTLISTGRWGRTPTGEFRIWVKLRSTRMSGGSGDDYYNLPNVPYVMFFGNNNIPASVGFSLHGTYWHNNFGHTMSHGCVNMKTTDVAKLYDWADPPTNGLVTQADNTNQGTKITIYGETPI